MEPFDGCCDGEMQLQPTVSLNINIFEQINDKHKHGLADILLVTQLEMLCRMKISFDQFTFSNC